MARSLVAGARLERKLLDASLASEDSLALLPSVEEGIGGFLKLSLLLLIFIVFKLALFVSKLVDVGTEISVVEPDIFVVDWRIL